MRWQRTSHTGATSSPPHAREHPMFILASVAFTLFGLMVGSAVVAALIAAARADGRRQV